MFHDIDALMKEVDKFNRNMRESDELTQRLLQLEDEIKQSNQNFLTKQKPRGLNPLLAAKCM